MSEFALIKTEAVKVLIEAIKDGIGVLFESKRIRRKAEAEAHAMQVRERALIKINEEKAFAELELTERINQRKAALEISRQQNIDDVIETTLSLLENETVEDPSRRPHKDWIVRFFDIVQDISDQEMKEIWARILASETTKPDSFSVRTLDLLRNLSKAEATMFTEIAKYALSTDEDAFILRDMHGELREYGIKYDMIARMMEVGFIHPESNVRLTFDYPSDDILGIRYGKKLIELNLKLGVQLPTLPIYAITSSGREILHLIEVEPSEAYIKMLEQRMRGCVESLAIK